MIQKECNHCNDWFDGNRDKPCSVHPIGILDETPAVEEIVDFDWKAELEKVNDAAII